MKKSLLLAAASVALAAFGTMAAETEIQMSYVSPDAKYEKWGTNKLENYDVAIHLGDPGLAGTKVIGFTCPVNATVGLVNIKGWLSTELKLNDKKVNEPNVVSVDATLKDGVVSVTFPTPYEMTDKGVYVGFSFEESGLTNLTMQPLTLATGTDPDGFWCHSSRTYRKWRTFESKGQVLPMSVTIAGDFAQYSLAATTLPDKLAAINEGFEIPLGLSNYGSEAVTSLDYAYTVGDGVAAGTGSVTFKNPIPVSIGAKGEAVITIDPIDELGTFDLNVTVTKVNGQENLSSRATASSKLTVAPFVPVNRPLMEEYTGLWCGFCPRGFVGMERLNEEFGDRFVCMSYHSGSRDPMECVRTTPNPASSFPLCYLNRSICTDPYYGTELPAVDYGIRNDWMRLASEPVYVDVEAALEWADDNHTALRCFSRVRFVNTETNTNYRLSYALVADGLTEVDGRTFKQSNYFVDDNTMVGEDWAVFVNGEKEVEGLTFNDVVVAYSDQQGIAGSVPDYVESGKYYSHSYRYDLPLKNIYGSDVVSDYNKVRCIVILTDGMGRYINSCSSGYVGTSGIKAVASEDTRVVATDYFNLSGVRVNNPEGGVFIRVDRYDDGTVIPSKVKL